MVFDSFLFWFGFFCLRRGKCSKHGHADVKKVNSVIRTKHDPEYETFILFFSACFLLILSFLNGMCLYVLFTASAQENCGNSESTSV